MARTASRLKFFVTIMLLIGVGTLLWVEYQNGTLPQWWAMMHPAPQAPTPATTPPPKSTPIDAPADSNPRSIFSDDGATGAPRAVSPAPTPAPAPAPAIATPTPALARPPVPTLAEARSNLDAATATVERSLANDPAYLQAKADVAAADAKRQAALAESGPGSPQVQEASSAWLNEKSKLKKLVDAAVAKDPAAQAAQREMNAAEASAGSNKARNGK